MGSPQRQQVNVLRRRRSDESRQPSVYGVQCRKLEAFIHKVFAPALFDLTIPDRFGNEVKPREWFLVPISAIDEAVEHIRDGSIVEFVYDPQAGRFRRS